MKAQRQQEIPKVKSRFENPDNWANIADQYMLQPIYGGEGRVLVLIDGFKSKYDCTMCRGKGHTDEKCPRCNGAKVFFNGVSDAPCTSCSTGEGGVAKTYGFKLCPQCNGRQGTIIIPDTSQKNTDTGNVLAISRTDINEVKPKMKVLLATYSGIPFRFMDMDMKVIVEKDILGIIRELGTDTEGLHQGTYADLENLGVPHEKD